MTSAADAVRRSLQELEVEFDEPATTPSLLYFRVSGNSKPHARLVIGPHSVTVNAFVVRHPDENTDGVHQWLLRQNAKHPGLAYGMDPLGDIYLVGQLPLAAVNATQIDSLCWGGSSIPPTRRSTRCWRWVLRRAFGASGGGGCREASLWPTSPRSSTSLNRHNEHATS